MELIEFLDILFKRWKTIASLFGVTVFFTIIFSLRAKNTYIATANILPSPEASDEILGEGITSSVLSRYRIPGYFYMQSSDFYKSILLSRTLLERVVQMKFYSNQSTGSYGLKGENTLIEIYGIKGSDESKRLYKACKKLASTMKVRVNDENQIITISVKAYEPKLAADITNAIVDELNKYNRELRSKKVSANKAFIEGRLNETQKSLRNAEEVLKNFQEKNRRIQDSPELYLQFNRLKREVKLQEELFITLTKQYELAKISEVRDTPMLLVLDKAIPPIHKSAPKRKQNVLLAGILALILGISLALVSEYSNQKGLNIGKIANLNSFKRLKNDFTSFFGKLIKPRHHS
ncbi:MAG: GNVR domain-containing protein [bacterium]|nr:GNVR domain-containing protein [bacterium]